MYNHNFTTEEIAALQEQRYNYPDPQAQKKMDALILKAHCLPHNKICQILDISQPTLRSHFEQYEHGGIEELKRLSRYKPVSELENHRNSIVEEFEKNPPATIKEAAARIEALTGIKRSEQQVRVFLKKTNSNG